MNKYWKIIVPILLVLIMAGFLIAYKQNLFGSHTSVAKVSDASNGSLQGYFQEAQQLSSANNGNATTTTTFLAVGDIMLSRGVASQIQKAGNVDYPFSAMANILKGTDFNFANLEGPVAANSTNDVIGGNSMTFGDPTQNLNALKDYNFQIINLANNHAWDQGLAGIDATKSTLDHLGIAYEGTGDNLNQAWTPAVVNSNAIKICFVGAAYGTNSGGSEAAQYVAEISDVARLKTAITTAKSECDFVVATMHAGIEYTRTPNQQQITFAHTAIDDGADIVIGAHPHWIQPIEKYNGKYIFYSLGNFVFDQDFSQDTMQGLSLKITLSKNTAPNALAPGAATADDLQGQRQSATLNSIQLIPIDISNSQVRPAMADEIQNILQKIKQNQEILYP